MYCTIGLGRSSPRRLCQPCVGKERRTQAGDQQLKRLAKGLPPLASMQWPAPLGTAWAPDLCIPTRRLMAKASITPDMADAFPAQASDSRDDHMHDVATPVETADDEDIELALPMGLDTDSDMYD